jgi:cell division GTPase FtsZ
MKSVLVGVGQAGGKVSQALGAFDADNGFGTVQDAVAVNTAKADLRPLSMDTVLIGEERVGGHGVGADNELGAEIMQSDVDQVMGALDGRITAGAESIVVAAGLGGGTGSGGAPALVSELKRVYEIPVYVLGVIPGGGEGSIYQVNAGRSLKTVAREADATVLVSNDAWRESGESMEEGYEAINRRIARRIGLLFAAGEPTGEVGESVVDSSEVINTLRSGRLASIGYASAEAAPDPAENIHTIMSTTRNALLTGNSVPDVTTADAALFVVVGHPDRIPRKGTVKARQWLEDELGCMEVRAGDFPIDNDRIAIIVLLGGIERSDRIEDLLERARQAQNEEETEAVDSTESLVTDDLDGVF